MLIGLTGKYCAGKNHIASVLERRGLPVLDLDKLGHAVIQDQKAAVFGRFGEEVKNSDGSVNRRLLGVKVFGSAEEMAALEAIVHPGVNRLTLEWIAAQNGKPCIINAALLHKSAVFGRLDGVILVSAPLPARLLRAKKRDKLPWAAILKRFSSQKKFFTQYLAGNADIYRVENSGFGLEGRIDTILSKLGLNSAAISGMEGGSL